MEEVNDYFFYFPTLFYFRFVMEGMEKKGVLLAGDGNTPC